ncbi:MAG: helix-turn-helix domain-containing protein [Flavobacteriaceae bacterium]
MNLEKGYLYHIYNQGNNHRKIFFELKNYLFFMEKMKIHLSPFVDVIAWCLMPNHFHFMVLVKEIELVEKSDTMTSSHRITKKRILNDEIGIMLRSYTRAINKQEKTTGSLFKAHTKAECINCFKGNTPSFISDKMTSINLISEKQYPQICFDYIHQNPVKTGMVKTAIEYEFSSAKDYAGIRDNKLINKIIALEYVASSKSQGFTLSETLTTQIKNPELDLALNFVENTDRNIFLTGKAGTGKTTFLHKIKTESLKRLVVVAPTGVAAINAKGQTIHSFFQMAFGPIVPGVVPKKSKFKFNKTKIDIIRSLDLLIIDEISMVRVDLLDGIDQVLRRYKDRTKVFGGVQVLMIGDLQQLAPVIKPYEWNLLSPHYRTPYFFSSKSFQEAHAISIELKHIYRQDNEAFIAILNEIRNNKLSESSAKKLNERFQPDFVPKKDAGFITLTTHNNRANAINDAALNKLKSHQQIYKASVKGKFNEYAYPTHEKLELKVGAQVMFIKNDSSYEKRYYNGKIGTVTFLDNDTVTVQCPDDDFEIVTTSETWENVNYSINDETKEITENISGSFEQIPLRLAWAITIHKSQGLTFEKAIIDAEASFAHGQTYVALSRCKTLEGIVLKTKIKESSIISDSRVSVFTQAVADNLPNEVDLINSKKKYQLNLMDDLFRYQAFLYPIQRLFKIYYENKTSLRGHIIEPLNEIKDIGIVKLMQVGTSFKNQLLNFSTDAVIPEDDKNIQERIHKGIHYFIEHSLEHIKKPLNAITFSSDNQSVKKDFTKQLDALEDLLAVKLSCLYGLSKGFSTKKYLELRAKAVLEKTEPSSKKEKKKRADVTSTEHPILFDQLKKLRDTFAKTEDVSHFQIFTQKSLFEMCEYFPLTKPQLKAINGMGKVRVEKYGTKILNLINAYFIENDVEPKEVKYVNSKDVKSNKNTKEITLELFQKGATPYEIATERGLTKGTIENHLIHFIPTGEVKITDLISENKYKELKKLMQKMKFDNFSDLKSRIDDKFTYGDLRLVAADLELDKK